MTCKKRLYRMLFGAGAVILAALAYLCVLRALGRGLDCPLWRATGLYCPGCGVSRMCLRLLRADLAGAFRANPLLLLALPALAGLCLAHAVRYVKRGPGQVPRWESRCWLVLAAVFVVYGAARNLPALAFLAPA